MFELRKPRPALVVDSDPEFLNKLRSDPKAEQAPPLSAQSGKEAQAIIANPNQPLAGVFVNPKLTGPGGISVVRFAHFHRPALPIFLIHEGDCPVEKNELKNLGIQRTLQKPLTYPQLINLVTPLAVFFDPKATLEDQKSNTDTLEEEITAEDTDFLPIKAADFLCGSKSFFDIYVQLSPKHYVKILKAGDDFKPERVYGYLQKGVIFFYLRKAAQERYLSYCDRLTTSILTNEKIPEKIKVTQTANHGQEVMNFFKNQGLSETHLEYANHFIGNVQTLTRQLKPERHEFLKEFLDNLAGYEHGISTAMIAALLIHPLKIEAAHPVKIIGLASMFHDLGLYKMDSVCQDENEKKMTPEQLKIYRTHPTLGADMLSSIRGMDPVVVQAVVQHHERRDKSGFPTRLGAGAINRVAEIVGISDELAKLIRRLKDEPSLNIQQEMEKNTFECFSNVIVEAFRAAFFPGENKPLMAKTLEQQGYKP